MEEFLRASLFIYTQNDKVFYVPRYFNSIRENTQDVHVSKEYGCQDGTQSSHALVSSPQLTFFSNQRNTEEYQFLTAMVAQWKQ